MPDRDDEDVCLTFVHLPAEERCGHPRSAHDATGECHARRSDGRDCECIEYDPGDPIEEDVDG